MVAAAPVKPSKIFGAGYDYLMLNSANPTPMPIDTPQDQSVTFKRDLKSITGTNLFPDDVNAGGTSMTWKMTSGSINGRLVGDAITGAGAQDGIVWTVARREKGVVNSSNTIRVKNNGAGIFLRDCGVIDPTTNLPLVNVATITKRNHYTVSATGLYTFHPSVVAATLDISYEWAGVGNGLGAIYNISNQPQGALGDLTAVMGFNWRDEQNTFTLNSNVISDFEIGAKGGDYAKPTISGMVQADAYGNIGTFSFAQKH
jgi:hypothetical protein